MMQERFKDVVFLAVEPEGCASMTDGTYRYDYGDTAGITPKIKMYTLGADYIPPPIHAGGLRYHGVAPTISALVQEGRVRPVVCDQNSALSAGLLFARHEGVIPAPESAHAISAAIECALEAKKTGQEPVILISLSGHGHFDMSAYDFIIQQQAQKTPDVRGQQDSLITISATVKK